MRKTGRRRPVAPLMSTEMMPGRKCLKKRFPELKRHYGEALYFCDELRSGTRSACKRRWTPKGHRPVCQMKLGYAFCCLYAALCPFSGHLLALILPDMTKESFCLFCDYFRKQTSRLYADKRVVLIAAKAGAHQSSVCKQRGFTLESLPTATPELNPVERFFQELRKHLSNRIFDTIDQVQAYLSLIPN